MDYQTFHARARAAIEFLNQLLYQVDDATQLVLVGDLSRFRDQGLFNVEIEPIPVENELYSESHGRLHIPLSGLNKFQLKKEVLPLIGIRTHIREVELVRYGRLLFQAHNFFRDEMIFSDYFQDEFVRELEHHGIIEIVHAKPQARIAYNARRRGAFTFGSNYANV
jgi:hypothetical protein